MFTMCLLCIVYVLCMYCHMTLPRPSQNPPRRLLGATVQKGRKIAYEHFFVNSDIKNRSNFYIGRFFLWMEPAPTGLL